MKVLAGKFMSTDKETGEHEYLDVDEIKWRLMNNVKDISLAINKMMLDAIKIDTKYMTYEFIENESKITIS